MPGLAETKVTSGQTRTWSQTDQSSSMRTTRPRRWIPIPVPEPSALIGVPETEFAITANSEVIAHQSGGCGARERSTSPPEHHDQQKGLFASDPDVLTWLVPLARGQELPALGEVAAPSALIRPDGHVAWAGASWTQSCQQFRLVRSG